MYVDPARAASASVRCWRQLEEQLRAATAYRRPCWRPARPGRAVRLYERAGYAVRPAFGGYPDNGLSVFYGKAP
jgi:putative acetyltransferase